MEEKDEVAKLTPSKELEEVVRRLAEDFTSDTSSGGEECKQECYDAIIEKVQPVFDKLRWSLRRDPPLVESIAKAAHGALRGYCKFTGGYSELSWDKSSAEHKEALIHGVVLIMNDPKVTVVALHEAWVAQKEAAGWKYDPVHNEEHKLHPCLTIFGKLNHTYQAKQHIFRGAVLEMLE